MSQHLYQALSDKFEQQIQSGVFVPGDRLPSVRSLSLQQGISIPTVLQCYRCLENKRLIEVRPKSGYYVSHHIKIPKPRLAGKNRPLPSIDVVRIPQLLHEFLSAAQDPQLVPLGSAIASPELLPIKKLNRLTSRILRRQPNVAHHYSPRQGETVLRQAIAKRLLAAEIDTHADEIVITQGCSEAVALALQSITQKGDAVIIESPSYQGHWFTLKTLGLKAVEVATDSNEGIDLEALESLMKSGKIHCALLMSNFQNPLGFQLSETRKQHIARLAEKYRIPVIEDDVFGDCSHRGTRPTTIYSYDSQGYVILCSSYSKSISPGYRIGYVCPGRYLNKLLDVKFGLGISAPALPQIVLAEYLRFGDYDLHLRRFSRAIADQTARMRHAIKEYFPPNTCVSDPQGGYVLWVEPPSNRNSLKLFERAKAEKISIIPGTVFSGRNRFGHCLRINGGYAFDDKIEGAVKTLGELLAAA